jgi:hypothetical protein
MLGLDHEFLQNLCILRELFVICFCTRQVGYKKLPSIRSRGPWRNPGRYKRTNIRLWPLVWILHFPFNVVLYSRLWEWTQTLPARPWKDLRHLICPGQLDAYRNIFFDQ